MKLTANLMKNELTKVDSKDKDYNPYILIYIFLRKIKNKNQNDLQIVVNLQHFNERKIFKLFDFSIICR